MSARPPATRAETVTFYKLKLAEARRELTRLRKSNRAYARDNERLCTRFYEDERTIKQLLSGGYGRRGRAAS